MLMGWKMLAESCNDCYCPLMQSKKGVKICCSCNRDFSKGAPTDIPIKNETTSSTNGQA